MEACDHKVEIIICLNDLLWTQMFFSCIDWSPGAPATAAAFSDQAVAATELRLFFLFKVKCGLQEQPLIFQLIFRVYFDVNFITDHLLHCGSFAAWDCNPNHILI